MEPNRNGLEMSVDLTDEALLEKFRQTKDKSYFRPLVSRYQNRLYNAALKILGSSEEAEDVVQDTFMKVHENMDKYRQHASFSSWVFRIANNLCMDTLRKRRRKFRLFLLFDPQAEKEEDHIDHNKVTQIADDGIGPEERLDLREEGEVVLSSLQQLPRLQRTVLVLRDVEGFSYEEIAEIIGVSVGTVRSRLYYARTKMKEILDPYFQGQASKNLPATSR